MKHRRRTLRFNLLFLSTVFIWCVPWGTHAQGSQGQAIVSRAADDTLSNEELHQFLSLFDHDKVNVTSSPILSTPSPRRLRPQPRPTPPSSSLLPTEVMHAALPDPILRRKSTGHSPLKKFEETSASDLIQQLSLLNTLMESSEAERRANQKVKAIIDDIADFNVNVPPTKLSPTTTTPTTTPKSNAEQDSRNDKAENDKFLADLQALALLQSFVNSGQASTSNDEKSSGGALLGLNTPAAPPALRNMDDKEAAAFLTNLLLSQSPQGQQQAQSPHQNFQGFTNSQVNLDAAASNQLSGLLSLLGTIGSLSGGSQMSNLLSLGSQQQQPSLLSGLLGGGQQQATSHGLLSTVLGLGNNQNQQQMNVLASLLGNQGAGSSIFTQQQQPQPPGVVQSLVGLGSSVSSVLGHSLSRLSGTRADGKPRVRGFDTRLGLGYRLGPNMDAQVMWEVGPQLFTEPLGEKQEPLANSASELREVRASPYEMSPEMQNKLAEVISRNLRNVQRRQQKINQGRVKGVGEQKHQRLGKLIHAIPSQYAPQIYHPRHHFRFQEEPSQNRVVRTHSIQHPRSGHTLSGIPAQPSGYIQPPPPRPQLNTQYPLASRIPGPTPILRLSARQANRNKRIPLSMSVRTTPPKMPEDSHTMLTDYEKWLLKKPQGIWKRELSVIDENQQRMAPKEEALNAFPLFNAHASRRVPQKEPEGSKTKNASSPRKRILRLTKRRPETTTPALPREMLLKRMGSLESPSLSLPPIPHLSFPPFRNVPLTMAQAVSHAPTFHHPYFFPSQWPRVRRQWTPQYHSSSIHTHNPYYNPHQNFIPESEDSFLRRNAIVTKPNAKAKVNLQNERHGTTYQVLNAGVGDLSIRRTASLSHWRQGGAMGGVLKKIQAMSNPVTRYLFPTTPLPALDDLSLGHFNPTTEPVLIATPTLTPIPSFYDHLGRPRPTKPTGALYDQIHDHDEHAFIHIGEELSYGDLAQSMDVSTRPRVRKYNGTKALVPGNKTATAHATPRPLPPPGMEMFIDIESGEVSVRKAVASLAHFGELSSTPIPKTGDELEDEESLSLYERLQDYLKRSREAFHLKQALLQATKEQKDKIRLEQDESLGLVNRYFDLLDDNDDELNIAAHSDSRRRRGAR